MNRTKERFMDGYCDVNGKRIYFYGKVFSVSTKQALYYIACDMQKCFNTEQYLRPVLKNTTVFDSSMWLFRNKLPPYVKYYEDEARTRCIEIDRRIVSFAGIFYNR